MQKIIKGFVAFSAVVLLASCGGEGAKNKKGDLGDLKVTLEKKKKEKSEIDAEIRKLEEQIGKADPSAAQVQKLVSVDTLAIADFTHFIELQGRIGSDNIVNVTPRGMPAQLKKIYVKKGDAVRKGQLLAKLDDAVMVQQMDGLKTQLAYAENLYGRQKSLWDQGIGTEVQVINAKNSVDALKKQLASMNEQWNTSFVYAPISGVMEEVNIREGETFAGFLGVTPQLVIVNASTLKIVTEVPENYISRVRKGATVEVVVPETGKPPYKTSISMVGASIDPTTRSFTTEARLPADQMLKPNQLATMRIQDYTAKNAVTVPINVVQTDEKGKYVYVMEKAGNKSVARKKTVIVGEAYNGFSEIKSGLTAGDVIIAEGYQTVYDGQAITTGN